MKVIKEKVLREYVEQNGDGVVVYAASLVNLLEELDTLTVSKLRPMRDAFAVSGEIIEVFSEEGEGREAYYSEDKDQFIMCGYGYDSSRFIGWIPKPTYNPEKE